MGIFSFKIWPCDNFSFQLCHNWISFNNVSGFNSKVNSCLKNFQLKHPLFLYPTLNFLISILFLFSIKKVLTQLRSFRFRFMESERLIQNCDNLFIRKTLKRSIFTTSKTDRQLLHQKVCQRISVFSWRQQKHQCLFSTLRFFDKLFDVIIDDPFLIL